MTQGQLQRLIAQHTPTPKRKADGGLVPKLITAASKLGARLFRNQVGTYKLIDGRYITSGLCVGSSDLIGYTVRIVTPEMVGQKIAIFTAIEAKASSGRATDRQMKFIADVQADGGIAQIVRSETELGYVLKRP